MRNLIGLAIALLATTTAHAQHVSGGDPGLPGSINQAYTSKAEFPDSSLVWDRSHAGASLPLDVDHMTPTFNDNFNSCSAGGAPTTITGMPEDGLPDPHPPHNWFSSSGGSSGNGDSIATWDNSLTTIACSTDHTHVVINVWFDATGKIWHGGQIQTSPRADTTGFRQQYGYFEVETMAEVPSSINPWWSVWANGRVRQSSTEPYGETDSIETYLDGCSPSQAYITQHLWPSATPSGYQIPSHSQTSTSTNAYASFNPFSNTTHHSYGMLFTHDNIIIYYDRNEVERLNISQMGDDMREPQQLIIDSALRTGCNPSPDKSTKFVLDLYRATVWAAPAGSCYVTGGC